MKLPEFQNTTPGVSETNSRSFRNQLPELKRPTPGHVCHEYGFLPFPCPYPQSNHLGLPAQWPGEQHLLRCSTIACPHSNHWGFQSNHLRLNAHYELTKRIHNYWVGNVNVELGGFGGLSNNMPVYGNNHLGKRQRSSNVWATATSTQDISMLTRLKRMTGIWWKRGKKLPDLLLQPSVVLWLIPAHRNDRHPDPLRACLILHQISGCDVRKSGAGWWGGLGGGGV